MKKILQFIKKYYIFEIVTFILSLISLRISSWISSSQLALEREIWNYERQEKSANHISNAYDKIMENEALYNVWMAISGKIPFEKWMKFGLFIDQLEWLWAKYCQAQVFTKDLKDYRPFFEKICKNWEVLRIFKSKNGLSKICLDVIWEDGMWAYYRETGSCNVLK